MCTCGDCGTQFYLGDQGDNEEFCLRCERVSFLNSRGNDYNEHDDCEDC